MRKPSRIARAHAKINLDLRILGTRTDGYHEVSTLLQSLALHDELELYEQDAPFTLACDEPSIAADATNLVWRAASRLGAILDRSLDGLAITLRKRVPAQAGLGGGSADAAATLRLLAAWWSVELDRRVLARVAAELGADVPYFLVGGTALGTRRGELILPLADFPEHQVLVVLPPFGVSTRDAYAWFDAAAAPSRGEPPDWRTVTVAAPEGSTDTARAWSKLLPHLRSDLEPVVAARYPEIATAVGALRAAGAVVATMSGSGSGVVGLFRTTADAEHASRLLGAMVESPGWRLLHTETIDRNTYERGLIRLG